MTFDIPIEWCRRLDDDLNDMPGSFEDEATLGKVLMNVGQNTLTHALDLDTQQVRRGANLSAYRLAEWMIRSWWRLRWEPARERARREHPVDWQRAHDVASIGGGWLWPNVTITSDGFRIVLDARPSAETATESLRYLVNRRVVIAAGALERGVDDLVDRVLARLGEWSLCDTDLHTAWNKLQVERNDPEFSTYRKIEACLGFDVDEADPRHVQQIISDGQALGSEAMSELAADRVWTAAEIVDVARSDRGFDVDHRGQPSPDSWEHLEHRVPWQIGVGAAAAVRQTERLGDGAVSDRRLAALCGIDERALHADSGGGPLAFALQDNRSPGGTNGDTGARSRVVLRSKWRTGRRFEAARLLADTLLVRTDDRLRPATAAYTYRQKVQRAFAAELLCPVESLADALAGDFSDEAQQDAAERFGVSPLAVTSVLANNGITGPAWVV